MIQLIKSQEMYYIKAGNGLMAKLLYGCLRFANRPAIEP
jgi:hypothetical protein